MEPQSKIVASKQPAKTEETKPPHLVPINGTDRPPKENNNEIGLPLPMLDAVSPFPVFYTMYLL